MSGVFVSRGLRRAVLVVLSLAVRPDPAAAAPRCETSGKTLMASAQVRVFRAPGAVHACWVPRARVRRLAADPAHLAVATRWVAWSTESCELDETCTATVHVLDVRKGVRVRSRLPGGAVPMSLVLDRRGIPAWVERAGGTYRVVARARDGSRRVLADHPAIHPRSLALARSYVYWSQDGEARTAPLP